MKPRVDVMDISSSDTEALLDLLFLSPTRDSPTSHPRASSDADLFENWPKANDMSVSVYATLSADALGCRKHAIDACAMAENLVLATCLLEKTRKTPWRKVALTDTP
jgi:hypothetical protein